MGLDNPLYARGDASPGMSEGTDTSSAKYLKDHLEQIVVETSETTSAPGRLKLRAKKEKPRTG